MTAPSETDVLVVGGGIHGVGVAQAAAAAGHRVVLLEKSRLADGTSSRSSKLIHGGLRYLESGQFRLVRESLRERELLLRLAPTLVHRQPFFLPVYPHTTRRPLVLRAGLSLYSLLAGLRRGTGFRSVPRSEWANLDGLQLDQATQVFQYWDAQTDDRLLTQAVMRSAERLGAIRLEGAELREAKLAKATAAPCEAIFRQDGREHAIRAAVLVNAAGPWVNLVLSRIHPTPRLAAIDLVGGTHLELPGRIEKGCYYVEAPQDRRAVFVMPWGDRTMLGTTERTFTDDPDSIAPTTQETEYLLEVYRHYFPRRSTEVLDAWAGLRVLPQADGAAFGRSRETQYLTDDPRRPRVVSIVGGKLTGYRAAAEQVMRVIGPSLTPRRPVAETRSLPLE